MSRRVFVEVEDKNGDKRLRVAPEMKLKHKRKWDFLKTLTEEEMIQAKAQAFDVLEKFLLKHASEMEGCALAYNTIRDLTIFHSDYDEDTQRAEEEADAEAEREMERHDSLNEE